MNSHQSLTAEVRELSKKTIMDKCNSKRMDYEVFICDFGNWMIDRFKSHFGKNHIQLQLVTKGYEVCKKKDADHYVMVKRIGSDLSELNFWLRKL